MFVSIPKRDRDLKVLGLGVQDQCCPPHLKSSCSCGSSGFLFDEVGSRDRTLISTLSFRGDDPGGLGDLLRE